jgi:hypothetical protein
MQTKVRTHSGAIIVLSGLPALVQSAAAQTGASSPPSAPDGSNSTQIGDPGWFVAGFVTGLVVGAVAGKVFGGSKSNNQG